MSTTSDRSIENRLIPWPDGNTEQTAYARSFLDSAIAVCEISGKHPLPGNSSSLALFGGVLAWGRESHRRTIRVTTPATDAITDLLAHQHHDQTASKHDGTPDNCDLIVGELCSEEHGFSAPLDVRA